MPMKPASLHRLREPARLRALVALQRAIAVRGGGEVVELGRQHDRRGRPCRRAPTIDRGAAAVARALRRVRDVALVGDELPQHLLDRRSAGSSPRSPAGDPARAAPSQRARACAATARRSLQCAFGIELLAGEVVLGRVAQIEHGVGHQRLPTSTKSLGLADCGLSARATAVAINSRASQRTTPGA